MPEREPPKHHDESPNPEEETSGYWRAARFKGEKDAGRSYQACQHLIREPDVDLSAFRFQLNKVWHVAVLGPTPPPEEIAQEVEELLSPGEPTALPPDILNMLLARRKQALSPGAAWVERHYRPGKRL